MPRAVLMGFASLYPSYVSEARRR